MITFLVVGDNVLDNEKIAGSIIGGTEMSTCAICLRSTKEALRVAGNGSYRIDLFIISIKMKEQSGYRLAEMIRKIKGYENTPILFITNLSYNLAGFESLSTYESYKKFNYISLPISRIDVQGKFGLYVEKIIRRQTETARGERAIYLKHNAGEVFVDVRDILFAEVQNKICVVHTKSNKYTIDRCSLQKMIETIDNDCFIRCHKSFAVNVRQIKGVEKYGKRIWQAVFESDASCPVSKTYVESVLEKYKTQV